MLMTALGDNPIHCLDCNLEVDPTSISLPIAMVEPAAHWQRIAGAFERLELDSGPYEAMAEAELLDLGSPVNEEGLTLRLDLDQQVRRCFYVVPQVMTSDGAFAVPEVCPKCGNQLIEYKAGLFPRLICDVDSLAWVNLRQRGRPTYGERDYFSAIGNELYEAPDRRPGEPGSVHIGDGGSATLCGRPLSRLVPIETRDTATQEMCEKCLTWARDLSLIE